MNILKRLIYGLTGLILLLLAIGFFLPSKYRVSRSMEMKAPVDQVYDELVNLQNWQNWNPWQKMDTQIVMSYAGPEAGVGAEQQWTSKEMGNGSLKITEIDTNKLVKYVLMFEKMPPMEGRFELIGDSTSTTITWIAEGDMGNNPVKKYFGVIMDGMMGKDFETGLANIRQHCE
jgi:hypothetical protein